MNFRLAFHRSRLAKFTVFLVVTGFFPAILATPSTAAAACVLNTDYIKDTSSVAGYTILKFTRAGSCSFRNTDAITTFEYLVVGGGGGGGAHVGGGGGGGGVLTGTSTMAGLGAIPITVGAGGTGAHANSSGWVTTGSNGGNSTLNGVVAYGGGKGGIWTSAAPGYENGTVGSAGGSGWSGNYGGGTTGQGRAGGTGNDVQPHAAGGGGGAGQVGGNGTQTASGNGTGGKGGDGVASSITGTSTYYGGGGGGGVHGNNNAGVYTGGAGGLGGGGAGSSHSGNYNVTPRQPANYGTSGTANTGGGGGGSGGGWTYVENKAGDGGSGIVVIKYLSSATLSNEVDSAINLTSSSYFASLSLTGSDAVQPSSAEAFTMAAWIRPTSTCPSTRCTILSREGQMRLTILNGKLSFILYNTNVWGSWTQLTTGDIPVNSWSHVAITRNGTAIKLFLNGYQIASYTQSYAPLANNATYPFYVGIVYEGYDRFIGAIDEVKIWKSDRSSSLLTDMNSNNSNVAGLAAYWNFNEGSGSTAYNLVSGVSSDTDLALSSSVFWNSTLIAESTSSGPYTIVIFYRTYITGTGGWKAPTTLSNALTLVVGGGGGGGGGYQGGGGGAGGFIETLTSLSSGSYYPIQVGTGGRGAVNPNTGTSGLNSQAFGLTAYGGGNGASEFDVGSVNTQFSASSGGSGGGGSWGSSPNWPGGAGTSGQGFAGGTGYQHTSWYFDGGGGGGATAVGSDGSAAKGGNGGAGKLSSVTGTYLAGGGGGSLRNATVSGNAGSGGNGGGGNSGYVSNATVGAVGGAVNGTANTGGGGGAGMSADGSSTNGAGGAGGAGGSGIVAFKYITASVPSYTKPTNAYLNVGMTETFTVNVLSDSATSVLTRTFKWESSTAGSAGPWRTIKEGTGAANASFSWVPSDTSTSGSNFLYRLTVTDSDTAGLYITDSSTAYAVINLALGFSGTSTIKKTINSSKTETYTVTNGTPTYRYSLSPTTSGITLDSSTAGYPRILLAETLTVGTYLETLTVTDSVSATYSLPLTITVSGPPSLTAAGEIVKDGQVLNLDAGNSQSILLADSATATSTVWNDISGNKKHASTSTTVNSTTCNAPTYSADYGGILTFRTAGSTCYATPYLGTQFIRSYSVETWFRLNSATLPSGYQILSQQYNTSGENIAFAIGDLDVNDGKIRVGYFDGSAWRYAATGYTPTRNSWVHIIGTYDGTNVKTYINGSLYSSTGWTGGGGSSNLKGILIGKRWDSTYYVDGSFGEVRVYNRAITSSEVSQNYNATKVRYQDVNLNLSRISQKHNTSTTDSFTVTSGGETRTVTYSVGNRSGVTWSNPDTSTVQIQVGPELLVGTFYDTVTVTDNFSSSTSLPVKITISKGDQAKLSIGQYNAFPGVSTYPINVYGGSGTGAVTRTLTNAGTAGCSLASSMYLTATSVGSCTVQAVKATDANFLAETATATIYWIQWSDAYATRAPSTPTEIVLNHQTAITKYNYETLTVTSYQNASGTTITSIATGAVLRIIGDGFDPAAAYTEVVFASMDAVDLTSGLQVVSNGSGGYYLQLTMPSGVTTGAITVNSPKGTARGPSLTITP